MPCWYVRGVQFAYHQPGVGTTPLPSTRRVRACVRACVPACVGASGMAQHIVNADDAEQASHKNKQVRRAVVPACPTKREMGMPVGAALSYDGSIPFYFLGRSFGPSGFRVCVVVVGGRFLVGVASSSLQLALARNLSRIAYHVSTRRPHTHPAALAAELRMDTITKHMRCGVLSAPPWRLRHIGIKHMPVAVVVVLTLAL